MKNSSENSTNNLLQKWLSGDITRQQERQLEEKTTHDPFLAEAMQGFQAFPEQDFEEKMSDLKGQLQQRYQKKKTRIIPFYWSKVAAAVAFVVVAGGSFWFLNQAINEEQQSPIVMENFSPSDYEKTGTLADSETIEETSEEAPITLAKTKSIKEKKSASNDNVQSSKKIAKPKPSPTPLPTNPSPLPAPPASAMNEPQNSTTFFKDKSVLQQKTVEKEITNEEKETLKNASEIMADSDGFIEKNKEEKLGGLFGSTTTSTVVPEPYSSERAQESKPKQNKKDEIIASSIVSEKDEKSQMQLDEVVVSRKESRSRATSQTPILKTAKPINGFNKFKKYIKKNIELTESAKNNGIEGTVIIQFKIDANGELSDFQVLESLGYGLDEEAIRLLQEGVKWELPTGQNSAVESYRFKFK